MTENPSNLVDALSYFVYHILVHSQQEELNIANYGNLENGIPDATRSLVRLQRLVLSVAQQEFIDRLFFVAKGSVADGTWVQRQQYTYISRCRDELVAKFSNDEFHQSAVEAHTARLLLEKLGSSNEKTRLAVEFKTPKTEHKPLAIVPAQGAYDMPENPRGDKTVGEWLRFKLIIYNKMILKRIIGEPAFRDQDERFVSSAKRSIAREIVSKCMEDTQIKIGLEWHEYRIQIDALKAWLDAWKA